MVQKFDFIVSLGENCISSGNLRRNKLQFESFPFDWIVIPFEQSVQMLQTRFKDFLVLENLKLSSRAENHDRYMDVVKNVEFVHDFDSNTDPFVNFDRVKNKYDRRIARLFQRIEDAQKLLLVVSSNNHFEDAFLKLQYQKIKQTFPNCQIELLCFELPQGEKATAETNVSGHIRRVILTSPDPNNWNALRDDYSRYLRPYKLKLGKQLKYVWPDFCFRCRKQLLKLAALLVPIPEIRRRLRQKVKKNIFE